MKDSVTFQALSFFYFKQSISQFLFFDVVNQACDLLSIFDQRNILYLQPVPHFYSFIGSQVFNAFSILFDQKIPVKTNFFQNHLEVVHHRCLEFQVLILSYIHLPIPFYDGYLFPLLSSYIKMIYMLSYFVYSGC